TKDTSRSRSVSVSYWFPGTRSCALVAVTDLLDVVTRLSIRRHLVTKLRHCTLACVVTSQHEIHAVIETIQQLSQVSRTTGNILRRIMRASHAKSCRCSRHQLQQTARALWRNSMRVEVRLLLHHQKDQIGIDVVLVTVLTNQTIETSSAGAPATRLLSRLRDQLSVFDFDAID